VARGRHAAILKHFDADVFVLNEIPFRFPENSTMEFSFRVQADALSMFIDGQPVLEARDTTLPSGGAGFLIEEGTVPARGFAVRRIAS
jgi:hypothetical protein